MDNTYPDKYLRFNDQQTKRLNVVVQIDGLPDLLSLAPVYTRVRYGDPGVFYGQAGLVYGGLRKLSNVRSYLSLDSALTISQRLEPEQGRASAGTFTLTFIDKNGYMSQLVAPGVLLEELLGAREVKILLGYQDTSYPDDYFVVFRGLVSQVTSLPGKVQLSLTDANQKRRAQTFYTPSTKLTGNVTNVATSIPVNKTAGFYDHIQGPDGSYDAGVRTWIKVEEEFMEYAQGDLGLTTVTVQRGGANSRGTAAVAHAVNSDVQNVIELEGNAIDLSLKVMLSGWNGPWKTGVLCTALGTQLDTGLPAAANVIVLPPGVDAVRDLGLSPGDSITIAGSTASNDGQVFIEQLADGLGSQNRLVYLTTDLNLENPAPTVTLALRSKYDVLPVAAGAKLSPVEVDVARHEAVRSKYFSGSEHVLRLFIQEPKSAKELIEGEMFLPIGAYSLTRYGRLSVGYTRPPVPEDKLVVIDHRSVVDPTSITIERGLNTRRFYNEVTYDFDQIDDGSFQSSTREVDTDSLNRMKVSSTLPIKAAGVKTSLGGALLAARRGRALLTRFKIAAVEVKLKVNWRIGSVLEAGDVVLLKDEGLLKITNFDTGDRDLGLQLFEVIDRQVDIKSGQVTLRLLSGLGFTLNDRYATISPSSLLVAGSTATSLKITDSFGALYPGQEYRKWTDYVGLRVLVRSPDWSVMAERVFTGIDPTDNSRMLLATALPFTPAADYVVEVAQYPDSTDANDQKLYKLVHAYLAPTLTVVTGISATQFTVSPADAANTVVGQYVTVHNADFSISSPERKVQSVVGVTVTVDGSLGFTPAAGQKVDLVGFKDGTGSYRWL